MFYKITVRFIEHQLVHNLRTIFKMLVSINFFKLIRIGYKFIIIINV